jgi:Pvc16 N-terminal domain
VAGYSAIAAAGKSLERLLTNRFAVDVPVSGLVTKARLVRTDDFDLTDQSVIKPPVLTIFLVRVEVNRLMRAAWSGVAATDDRARLPLDLHYLLTPWAANAEHEQCILGSAMRCLEDTPILSGPLLDMTHDPQWTTDDAIQITTGDFGPDGIMRVWETLEAEFRLSVPYVARIVRVDGIVPAGGPPVLTAITGATPSLQP